MSNGDLSQLIDLLLVATRDLNVFILILFILGIAFIVFSLYDIQPMGIKIQPRPEYRKWTIVLGSAIALISFLLLLSIWFIPKGVEVYGTVKYQDGTPVRNADVSIGPLHKRTDMSGEYRIYNAFRNETEISIKIKDRDYIDTLELPNLYWKVIKNINISNVKMGVSGEVRDESGNEVEGAYVNLSGYAMRYDKTDSEGKFDFGTLDVPFVPAKPLILAVKMPNESKPRLSLNIEIPSKEPFEKYLPVSLPSEDTVDVLGKVLFYKDLTSTAPESNGTPIMSVKMGTKRNQTDISGNYRINDVRIDTIEYEICSPNGLKYCNRTIDSPLKESGESPRNRQLILYLDEINQSH